MERIILLILFYFLFPLVIIRMCKKWPVLNKLGSIVLAYGFGLLLGSLNILPSGSDEYEFALQGKLALPEKEMQSLLSTGKLTEDDLNVNQIATAQDNLISILAPLSFPLLLFSLNIRRWLRFAKGGFISMILALISVVAVIISGYFIFKNQVQEPAKIAGMLVGVYTGGTPNLVNLKVALNVDPVNFLMTSTYDMILGAITLIFIITLGPKFVRYFLPPFKHHGNIPSSNTTNYEENESFDDFSGMFSKGRLLPLIKALGISVLILGLSIGISFLFPDSYLTVIVILSVTTLAIMASLIPWVNRIEKTFQLGMYFILVFSFAVASMADLKNFFSVGFLGLFEYVLYAYFGSLVLHLILSRIFRVNGDDYLITMTAFLYSPPFVPVVAGALKNKDVIITGITVGILGYIIGNYLGTALWMFLNGR